MKTRTNQHTEQIVVSVLGVIPLDREAYETMYAGIRRHAIQTGRSHYILSADLDDTPLTAPVRWEESGKHWGEWKDRLTEAGKTVKVRVGRHAGTVCRRCAWPVSPQRFEAARLADPSQVVTTLHFNP